MAEIVATSNNDGIEISSKVVIAGAGGGNEITDDVTGKVYKIIISNGELGIEEIE